MTNTTNTEKIIEETFEYGAYNSLPLPVVISEAQVYGQKFRKVTSV